MKRHSIIGYDNGRMPTRCGRIITDVKLVFYTDFDYKIYDVYDKPLDLKSCCSECIKQLEYESQ